MGTAGNYLYRPAYKARGYDEFLLFDAGLLAADTAVYNHIAGATEDHTQYPLLTGSRAFTGGLSGTSIWMSSQILTPTVSGGNIWGTALSGNTVWGATALTSPLASCTNVWAYTLSGNTVWAAISATSPIVSGGNVWGVALSGNTVWGATSVTSPIISGGNIWGTALSGNTVWGATSVTSPIISGGDVMTIVGSAAIGTTAEPVNTLDVFGTALITGGKILLNSIYEANDYATFDLYTNVNSGSIYISDAGSTTKDTISLVSTAKTSGHMVNIYHSGSAMTGQGIAINLGNTDGSFSGNFCSFASGGTAKFTVDYWGNIISQGILYEQVPYTPASSGAAGSIGAITWDTSYIYVCIAANEWKRAPLAAW